MMVNLISKIFSSEKIERMNAILTKLNKNIKSDSK